MPHTLVLLYTYITVQWLKWPFKWFDIPFLVPTHIPYNLLDSAIKACACVRRFCNTIIKHRFDWTASLKQHVYTNTHIQSHLDYWNTRIDAFGVHQLQHTLEIWLKQRNESRREKWASKKSITYKRKIYRFRLLVRQ